MRNGLLFFFCGYCLSVAVSAKPIKKDWTYLFYIAGDEEEIDRFSRVPIRKLEQIGSDDERWFVVHTDFHYDEKGKKVISESAFRYVVGKFPGRIDPQDYKTLKIRSPVVWRSQEETNSSSADSLLDFLQWAVERYPAEHYALFIVGHSWGWRGIGSDFNPGIDIPKNPGGPEISFLMGSLGEYRDAIGSVFGPGRKLDLLVMDACIIGVLEFIYEVRDLVRLFVAPSTEMPFMSYDYARSLGRRFQGAETLARYLVTDALVSFAREGFQAGSEGDYSALSLFGMDLERMKPLWPIFKELIGGVAPSDFGRLFLREQNSKWLDLGLNADLGELLGELEQRAESLHTKDLASVLLRVLGEPNPMPAPDSLLREIPMLEAGSVRFKVHADEKMPEEKSLAFGREVFEYLNPHLKGISKSWRLKSHGSSNRVLEAIFSPGGTFNLRPFIAGATWAELEILKEGTVTGTKRWEAPKTFYVRTEFPNQSPYLVTGHTFGAGRNHGISIFLDPVVDMKNPENYHFGQGRWIGGRDYYRSLSFSQDFGWGDLLFGNWNSAIRD